MDSFANAAKALDQFGQDIPKHAGNAAKELDQFGQDIPKHAGNAAKELDQFGQDIPKHAGNAAKELDQFGQDIPKHAGNIIEHVGKHVATTVDDLRNALLEAGEKAGNYVGDVTETVKNIDWEGTAYGLKDWVVANPELAVAIAAAVVVPMISIAVVPPVLGTLGWTAGGVAAGQLRQTQYPCEY
jgi:hypothetical protein